MKIKGILIALLLIASIVSSGQYREVDWKTNVTGVVVLGIDTFEVTVDPIDYNDPGAITRTIGNYLIDFVGNRYSIIDSTATTITVVSELAGTNTGPQTGQIARVYRSVGSGAAEFIGGVDMTPLDESSRWKKIAADNELFWRAIDTAGITMPLDTVAMDTTFIPSGSEGKGVIFWDDENRTLSVSLGNGVVGQILQETLSKITNNSGGAISDGEIIGISTSTGLIEKAIATNRYDFLAMATEDIANGAEGFVVTLSGVVRGLNTSGDALGKIWLSETVAGAYTQTAPEFTDYEYAIGSVIKIGTTDGEIRFSSIGVDFNNTIRNAWNGSFRETINFTVSSDGATVTGSLEQSGGGDLTMIFSDGFTDLDCTPAQTVALTAGTDANPQMNYVYIPKSTKALTVSTSGFPSDEHIKVADLFIRSASSTQTQDAFANRNWNDHIMSNGDNGHLLHIAEKLRQFEAQWSSGASGTATVGAGTTVDISVTGGQIYQLHKQSFPAQNTATGDDVHFVNDFTTPYFTTSDPEDATADALGNSFLNTSYSWVLWGVMNKTGEASHIMINLPIGTYSKNTPENAVLDALGYSVYDIPSAFQGKGFLIARFTFVNNSGIISLYDTEDLRGKLPNSTAGGSAGGGGSDTFLGNTDTPSSYIGQGSKFVSVGSGESALEFSMDTTTHIATKYDIDTLSGGEWTRNVGKVYTNNPTDTVIIGATTTTEEAKLYVQAESSGQNYVATFRQPDSNQGGLKVNMNGNSGLWSALRLETNGNRRFSFYNEGWIELALGTTPGGIATPASGFGRLVPSTDKKIYWVDSDGNVYDLTVGGSGQWSSDVNGIYYNSGSVAIGSGFAPLSNHFTVDQDFGGGYLARFTNSNTINGYGFDIRAGSDAGEYALSVAQYDGTDLMDVRSDGRIEFDQYGSGTFTGTEAYNLAVTSAGVIVEGSLTGVTEGDGIDVTGNVVSVDVNNATALVVDPATNDELLIDDSGTTKRVAMSVLQSYMQNNLSFGGGGGAPTDATYITQTANATLTNEQALSSLSTGFMKSTTGTGVVSTQSSISLSSDVSGNLPVTNLNSGTGASSSTFWRGDGQWATPAGGGNVSTSGTPVVDDYAQFVNGTDIRGRSSSEVKTDLSLNNVDNTSDANKPISTATQTALDAKQDELTLTTTGTSGAATLVGATLNIPIYSSGGGGNVSTSGTPVVNDYAQFVDGTDIRGRSYTEVKTDLELDNVENTALSTWAGTSSITNVGTIATGVWAGTAITEPNGGTGQTTYTTGDILYATNSNTLAKLGIGSANQVLTVSSGLPSWQNASTGFTDPMTTIGDMIFRNGSNTTTRLPVGTNGQILKVTAGIPSWEDAAGGGDVSGPASSVDDRIATFNGTTGKLIQDGGSTIADVLNRSNHTGTQTASTISDFDTEVSNNTDVAANTSARHNDVTLGTANGLSLSVQQLSLGLASSGVTGALSGTDWNTFNNKLSSEVDGSITNEGSLTVGAGTASTSLIQSNTSGSTDVTLEAGSNITLSEAGNTITIASTGGAPSYGTQYQIPYTNSGGTDFDYESIFTYNDVSDALNVFQVNSSFVGSGAYMTFTSDRHSAGARFRFLNSASAPTSPLEGDTYYNTTDDKLYGYIGTSWTDLGASGGSSNWTYSGGLLYSANTPATDKILVGTTTTLTTDPALLQVKGDVWFESVNPVLTLSDSDTDNEVDYSINGDVAYMQFENSDVWTFDESDDIYLFKTQLKTLNQLNTVLSGTKTADFTHNSLNGDIGAYQVNKTGTLTISIHNLQDGAQGTIILNCVTNAPSTLVVNTYSDAGTTGLTEAVVGDTPTMATSKQTTITYTCASDGTNTYVTLAYGQQQ